jgi:hypothetical protein
MKDRINSMMSHGITGLERVKISVLSICCYVLILLLFSDDDNGRLQSVGTVL